ncbi:hypothetical protein SAY86_027563 [Trapa natans]|uniref:Ultraviolet-B-repressible protein n=1 Tax=Trapa natans TaxID=22666 RepID=A0AAN7QKU7_TRANT|nr:hypothetical protein SAY86_027563 [Trapa natans]
MDFSIKLRKNLTPKFRINLGVTSDRSKGFGPIRDRDRKKHAERHPKTIMASTCAISMALPFTASSAQRNSAKCLFKPLPSRLLKKNPIAAGASRSCGKLEVMASLKEKAIKGLTAAALTASMMIPEVAEAADSGVSPSLNNFLLSIVAGGVVVGAILGAVIGVANFDPVKRA